MFKWVHSRKNKKGFTLLELIVVMGVLAILVAMGVPKFLGYTKEADVTAMRADIKLLEQAGLQYALHNDDSFPFAIGDEGAITVESELAPLQGVELYAIDEAKVAAFVRSLKNDATESVTVGEGQVNYYANFGMTTGGEVYHLKGVTGSDGETHYGIDASFDPSEDQGGEE